jgi:hypothetical protein
VIFIVAQGVPEWVFLRSGLVDTAFQDRIEHSLVDPVELESVEGLPNSSSGHRNLSFAITISLPSGRG